MPGLHFLLGTVAAFETRSRPDRRGRREEKNSRQELEIDPSNAGAEYVLGELARQDQSVGRRRYALLASRQT